MNMKRALKTIVLIGVLIAVAWGTHAVLSGWSTENDELLYDRLWVTDIPEVETEFTHDVYVSESQDLGFFARSSMFRFEEELFEFQAREGALEMFFPQTERRVTVSYEIRSCNDLPPYNLCLDLDSNPWGGPSTYFGYRGDDEDEGRSRLDALRHRASRLRARHARH